MPTAPLLSIGIIFKNEERCLERCLKSLEPLRKAIPCELIMADTGATDGSRAIAQRYADEVFDFAWIDDFSAARNAVMDRCHGKWYLTVDCDEWLDADVSELLAFLQRDTHTPVDYAYLVVRDYFSEELEKGERYNDFNALRLLRMSTGQRYTGAIHESWLRMGDAYCLTHTILHHDGYQYSSPEEAKQKMRRNMRLLRRELEKHPEDLWLLHECIESSQLEPEHEQYIRTAVALIQKQAGQPCPYGACILRNAAESARTHEMPEMWGWIEYAEKEFPNSAFTRVDLQYTAFQAASSKEDWEDAIQYGKAYREGLQMLRSGRFGQHVEEELSWSALLFSGTDKERALLVSLANACFQTGQYQKALEILAGLDGAKLDAAQLSVVVTLLIQLHAHTQLDVQPTLAALYGQIGREEQHKGTRLAAFAQTAASAFTRAYRAQDETLASYIRPAYTAFAVLADQCEVGRAARLMLCTDPAEMQEWLLKVEDWQALPIEALEYALEAGASFPPAQKPLPIEVLDGLAAKLAQGDNPALQLALALPEDAEFNSLQSLYWTQALALAALQRFNWTLGEKDDPQTGLALLRRFAGLERALLPLQYTPQLLTAENAVLLPPMHRWGLYCMQAFEALDAGRPQQYLAALRKGLAACPGQKQQVQFLLDRLKDQQRPEPSPELLALAEKVRGILAAYGPDHPAARAIRESDAYKQVAYLIEDKSGSGHGAGTKRKKMDVQEFVGSLDSYDQMSKMLKTYDYQEILKQASATAKIEPEKLEQYPMGGYSKGMTSGAYRFVLKDLLEHIDHYDWLYSRFEDDISRKVFTHLIQYRLFPDRSFLVAAYDADHPQYYDKTIIKCNKDEVFVDCGAYNGDSAEKFIKYYGAYKHIYAYEPSMENIQACRNNLKKYHNVTVRHCGVGEKSAVLCMDSNGASSTFMREHQAAGDNGVQIISLDEDISEKITYCKMDIEGFEIPALLGAKRHIRSDFPKLAICVYHIVTDIWEIPRLIDSLHPGYRFFIRHYDPKYNWETVIYAIPPEKK